MAAGCYNNGSRFKITIIGFYNEILTLTDYFINLG
jgi:hypothetical protein